MFQIHLEKAGFIKQVAQRSIQIKTKVVRPDVADHDATAHTPEIVQPQPEQEDQPPVSKREKEASNSDTVNAA